VRQNRYVYVLSNQQLKSIYIEVLRSEDQIPLDRENNTQLRAQARSNLSEDQIRIDREKNARQMELTRQNRYGCSISSCSQTLRSEAQIVVDRERNSQQQTQIRRKPKTFGDAKKDLPEDQVQQHDRKIGYPLSTL
jgi:hypothetical protein